MKGLEQRHYHGDGEIYGWHGPEPGWVKVWFCKKHRKPKMWKKGEGKW